MEKQETTQSISSAQTWPVVALADLHIQFEVESFAIQIDG